MTALYENFGGDAGLKTAVAVFYARMTADPELAPFFADVGLDRLRAHQHAFLAAAVGGPELFTGRPLEVAHAGLGISDAQFDRVVDHLAQTLGDLGGTPADVAAVRDRVDGLRGRIVESGA